MTFNNGIFVRLVHWNSEWVDEHRRRGWIGMKRLNEKAFEKKKKKKKKGGGIQPIKKCKLGKFRKGETGWGTRVMHDDKDAWDSRKGVRK